MSSQLRRALVSISSNVAEGTGKRTSRDFASYIYNALGST
ncbi:four helix bundle protein [Candidatus Pacearchaeota archaeon]|nr:four helix bundle protein [Candidatus Pacearchaeota archaeon]